MEIVPRYNLCIGYNVNAFVEAYIMYPHSHHQPDQPILDVKNVFVNYNGRDALENITFYLNTGERVAVVGPNGAGKSSLFKVISGVMPPTSGAVNISGYGPGGHTCIAYVPQRSQVDWRFPASVADVVMMGRIGKVGLFRWPRHADWEIVHTALETVEMDMLANRQIGELSGGQQQRTFLARAMAQEAELVLLDEPLNGLDTPSQEAIIKLLDTLHQQEITVMVATHDLGQAATHFDRVMLLNHQLIRFGLPKDVLTSENLLRAYGGHAKLIRGENGVATLADTCCDGEEEHE
jgi:manganese/iron transport system ATP-binding protein